MDDQKPGPQPPVPSPNQPGAATPPRQPGVAPASPPPRPSGPTGTVPTPRPPAAPQPYDIPTLGEEFDKAKWTLPPAQIVAIAVAGVAIALAIVMYVARYKPVSAGSLGDVSSVELADHNSVLVAINVTVRNIGQKPLWIHEMGAEVETDKGKFNDHAASAIDFERYYQAYPTLKQKALPALMPEMKIAPGGEQKGTIIVSFPVNEDTFNKRKALSVTVEPYDQRTLVISSAGEAGK
ncbi:MAG TPA: hypothetical protein VJ756_19665 [Terriglobales bacterium]|nr:hypothetical protein [Terriglobales bacterium]